MFSTFTTTDADHLIIRAIDIRRLEDHHPGACVLAWEEGNSIETRLISGSAEENLNRLKQEETDALIAAEKLRQRQSSGYPPEPIQRGKQSIRMVKP